MTISESAIQAVRKSTKAVAALMLEFDRTQQTIYNWLDSRDKRLTTANAVRLIGECTGLSEDEILEPETEAEAQN